MANIIRITKEFRFEGAHALEGYDGKCRHIHGHSYRMFITIKGCPKNEKGHPKDGMVIDFSVLKNIVGRTVVDRFDHALLMRKGSVLSEEIAAAYGNVILTDFQPTCENLAGHIASAISAELPDGVTLHSVKLYETESSYVEWFAEDNSMQRR